MKRKGVVIFLVIMMLLIGTTSVSAATVGLNGSTGITGYDGDVFYSGELGIAHSMVWASLNCDSEDGTVDVFTEVDGYAVVAQYLEDRIVDIYDSGWNDCYFYAIEECEEAYCEYYIDDYMIDSLNYSIS